MTLTPTDKLLVNRSDTTQTVEQAELMATLQDDDLLLINRSNQTYTITGEDLKDSIGPGPISFTPTISGNNETGDVLTANAGAITGGTAPVEYAFQWKRNDSDIAGATSKTHTIVSDDVGETISCELIVAEPDGTGGVLETAVYDQIPEQGVEVVTPVIIAPPDGAGIGGDVTYTPKTSAVTDVVTVNDPWNLTSNLLNSGLWRGITYGNNTFVTVSEKGEVGISSNGIDWSLGTEASGEWIGVTYGNGTFVAVADKGTSRLMTSTGGINWNKIDTTLITTNAWRCIAYGEPSGSPMWVVLGEGVGIYSTDAANWNPVTTDVSGLTWVSVTYGNGTFVAVAQSGTKSERVITSTDGINWTYQSSLINQIWKGVAYGNGTFVAVAQNGAYQVAYSTDNGVNWSFVPLSATVQWSAITYNDGKFVAVGSNFNETIYSTNGINWNFGSTAAANNWSSITYGDNKFVAVATNGTSRLMWSVNGTGVNSAALTLADANTYNADTDADMGVPISETFTAGQTVTGVKAGSDTAVGTLTADASGNTMVMYSPGFGGSFVDGMEVINSTTVTRTAPSADDLEFVGSTPTADPTESINTWGDATWEVSTDSNFTAPMVGTKIIMPNVNQTLLPNERGAIVLDGNTDYHARLSYNATNPSLPNVTSSAVHFRTADKAITVDDVFNVTVYAGNDAGITVDSGVNYLEDALIWLKNTSQSATSHTLFDLPRDNYSKKICSNTNADESSVPGLTPSNGSMSVAGGNLDINMSGYDYVSYSFKAEPRFFDIVEWIGDGSSEMTIPHSLGSAPGCIIAKSTTDTGEWYVYHITQGPASYALLNYSSQFSDIGDNQWEPTDISFKAVSGFGLTSAGKSYVAYLFADTPGLIKCGTYTASSSADATTSVDCGFEPQWVIVKIVDFTGPWAIRSNKSGGTIFANTSDIEGPTNTDLVFTSTGFDVSGLNYEFNRPSASYVYIAIAKGGATKFFDTEAFKAITDNDVIAKYGVDPYTANLEPFGIKELTHEPVGVTAAFAEVQNSKKLEPVQALENTVGGLQNEVEVADAKLDFVKERNKQLRQYMAKDMIAEAQALIEQWAAEDAEANAETQEVDLEGEEPPAPKKRGRKKS